MQRDYAESLLRSGIIEAKAGESNTARRYLKRAIYTSGDHDLLAEAWYWISQITDDPDEKRSMLENCLAQSMRHTRARRELAILEGKLKADEIINPDALPPAPLDLARADADRFMCPQCGARMAFSPDGDSLVCDFCTQQQELANENDAEEQDFLIAMATARGHRKPVATQVFHCQGCGSQFLLPPGVISTSCAYCDSPHVVSLDESRDLIQPDGILPHALQQKQVNRILVEWVQENQIEPQDQVDFPRGVYLPVWTFDIGGGLAYRGERYEREAGLGASAQTMVHVSDEYPVYIDDLCIPASRKIASHLTRLIPTFDLSDTRPYDPRFLASWAAEVYDIPMANASLDARSRAYLQLKHDLPGEIASLHNLKTSSSSLTIVSFKLVLLPAWMTEIQYDNDQHLILINGQNGSLLGDDPQHPKPGLFEWLEDLLED